MSTDFDPRTLRAGDLIDDDPGGDYWLISFCREVKKNFGPLSVRIKRKEIIQ